MTKLLHEVFSEFEQRKTKHDRLAVLRFNQSWALKNVLKGVFDPNVEFSVEVPEYKKQHTPIGLGHSSIHQELGKAYLFEKNNPRVPSNLTPQRKTELLIQSLEALEDKEAEIFANMIRKNLKVKGLTYDLVKEAFPDLLPDALP